MYDYYVLSKLIFNCFICLIIYWIQTLENTNKIVKSEGDLIKEASEVDTASFWYVSEKQLFTSSNFSLFHMLYLL